MAFQSSNLICTKLAPTGRRVLLTSLVATLVLSGSCRTPNSRDSKLQSAAVKITTQQISPVMKQCQWGQKGHLQGVVYHRTPIGTIKHSITEGLARPLVKVDFLEPGGVASSLSERIALDAPDGSQCKTVNRFRTPADLISGNYLYIPVKSFKPTNHETVDARVEQPYALFRIFEVSTKRRSLKDFLVQICDQNAAIAARQEEDVTTISGVFVPYQITSAQGRSIAIADDSLLPMITASPAYLATDEPPGGLGPIPDTFVGWPVSWEATEKTFQNKNRVMQKVMAVSLVNKPFGHPCAPVGMDTEVF